MPKAVNPLSSTSRHTRAGGKRKTPYPPVTIPKMSSSIESPVGRASSKKWKSDEDSTLISARKMGMNWDPIAAKYFPGQTGNSCRKRHERIMDQKAKTEDWEGETLERLATAYMQVRQQMWSLVADRMGETKWEIAEAKVRSCHRSLDRQQYVLPAYTMQCMEKGLKNLQAAHRRFLRREREAEDSPDILPSDPGAEGARSGHFRKEPIAPDSAVGQDEEEGLHDSGIGRSDPADASLLEAVEKIGSASHLVCGEPSHNNGHNGHRLSIASMLSPLSTFPPASGG